MAQLRQDYAQFVQRNAEVVVVGPEDQMAFRSYWEKEDLPFVGLADPAHAVSRRYGQEVKLLKFGRMPALLVVDISGIVRYAHYGSAMHDIPQNRDILSVLDYLNANGRPEWEAAVAGSLVKGRV